MTLHDERKDSICGNKLGFGYYPEEAVQKHTKAFLDELEKYDKNKLMGKEFILISKKDLNTLKQKHFWGILK